MEDPPKKFFRLAPGREVRLRYGYFITCREAVKNELGEIIELRCSYDAETRGGNAPDGRKVKATLHWVPAAQSLTAEVRLFGPLFKDEVEDGEPAQRLNANSLEVLKDCRIESALDGLEPGTQVQFERLGYFSVDPDSRPGGPVYNRIVGLRDEWAKMQEKGGGAGR